MPITRSHMGWLMNHVILLKTIKKCCLKVATNHSYILSDFPKTPLQFDAKFTTVKTVKTYEIKLIIQISQLICRIGRKPIRDEFTFSDAEKKICTSLEVKTKLTLETWWSYPKKCSFDCVIFYRGNYICFVPFFEVSLFHLKLKI